MREPATRRDGGRVAAPHGMVLAWADHRLARSRRPLDRGSLGNERMQREKDDGLVAAGALADPDRLLPGEEAGAVGAPQIAHWIKVYSELLAVKDALLPELSNLAERSSPSAQDELGLDLSLLRAERVRLQRRFDFWTSQAAGAGLDLTQLQQAGTARALHGTHFSSITIGHVRFDVHAHDVWVEGSRRRLTPNEWRLLNYLVSRRGDVVSREEVASGAWGAAYVNRPGEVELYVSRLRKKIAHPLGWGPPLIETVRGRGYRLVDD